MTLETVSEVKSHGGVQGVYRHASAATTTDMVFSLFLPPQPERGEPVPLLWYLSGLTCTHANVTEKGEFREACARAGIAFIAPDTSPRGPDVPDDPEGLWDFGQGAGFYLDATQQPWATHFNMRRYILDELPALVAQHFPADMTRQSITGHSMGGHGALTLALSSPGRFRSVSAFAPIVAPRQVPWGRKALRHYLGEGDAVWRAHDTVALIEDGARVDELLVDIGEADPFLEKELRPELLEDACADAGIPLTLRRQAGYDHSYYFISTFMADHVGWHAERLNR
ncbi:S-formylglutathione hydrolase [Sphingomonas rhizophila]|uniref:S-formylglutathione hydrolase n=1 Tax=Sphingomonas rhizophila TaxID=2071607 RepID=A0A7G9SBA4_9SPHN|nr:S-formylglutathione hydrolase [Sphingomonas rhizophila]QNN65129.1 S-formylglutathione hydrolase [Sphingomonas rhizophila]